jgi:acetyl-CoA acetyltransferase
MEPDAEYFATEYGITAKDSEKAGIAMKSEAARARRTGKLREITKASDLAP